MPTSLPQKVIANTIRAYTIALTLVALLSTSAYLTLGKVIGEHQSRAEVINLSGRQRMLSQRIGLLAEKAIAPDTNQKEIANELARTVKIFEESHKELSIGSPKLGQPIESVKQVYFGNDQKLNTDVEDLVVNAKKILDANSLHSEEAKQALRKVRDLTDSKILPKLDLVVQLNQKESDDQVARLHDIEKLVLILTLLLLFAEAVLIFRPTMIRIKKLIQAVSDAYEKAVKATDDKSAFLATITHEIRTPLAGMWGVVESLGDSDLTPEKKEKLDLLERLMKSLMTLVDDILDYSKIEAGKLSVECIDFNVSSVAQDTYSLFLPNTQKKGVKLTMIIDPQMPKLLKGDPTRIRQVITNFVGNALKFTPTGGEIQVRFIQSASSDTQVQFKVTVQDTGCGIPSAYQSLIFGKYNQGSSATTRKFGGTGLGLAICKQLIEAMGGKIGFESQEGKGSLFWFEVLLAHGEATAEIINVLQKKQENKKQAIGSGFNLLLVEDTADLAAAISMVLKGMGFLVQISTNGKEAIEAASSRKFDVILMDHDLPDMTGIEATRLIRENEIRNQKRQVPILALTGHGSALTSEWQSLGVNQILSKPISRSVLQKELAPYLNNIENPAASL